MKPRPRKYDKQIEEIMCEFDFQRVHRHMKKSGWTWHDQGVPSIEKIKERALWLLEELAYQKRSCLSIATGGLEANWRIMGVLELRFVVAEYAYGDHDAQ